MLILALSKCYFLKIEATVIGI